MCKAQITTARRWLVGLVLFCNPMGALAQAPQYWTPDFHESNPPLAWGPNGHGNNEHSVPGLDSLGDLGDPGVEATSGPSGHSNNDRPVLGLKGLAGLSDLLPPQPVFAPLGGAPRAGAVPAPGAAALLALAALGAGRRRRRG